jgi:DNA repair ATPase RecN
MSEIKETIKKYIEIDDQIKLMNKELKPLREQKIDLGVQIRNYLETSDKEGAVIQMGSDRFKIVKKVTKKYSKELIEKAIKEKIIPATTAEEISEEKTESYVRRLKI